MTFTSRHFATTRKTYGTPTWIWSVVVSGALYVRGYNGQQSRWYQAAVRQRAGRIRAAGLTKEVVFASVDGAINNRVDAAYLPRPSTAAVRNLAAMIGESARVQRRWQVMPLKE